MKQLARTGLYTLGAVTVRISPPSKIVGSLVCIVGHAEEVAIAAEVCAHAIGQAEPGPARAQHEAGGTERPGPDDNQSFGSERSLFGLSERALPPQVMDQIASCRILGQMLAFNLCEYLGSAVLGDGEVVGIERVLGPHIGAGGAVAAVDALALLNPAIVDGLEAEIDRD